MRHPVLGALLWLTACGGSEQPAPRQSFDLDIVIVQGGDVTVWLREGFSTGCTEIIYPHLGECAPRVLPFACQPIGSFCLEEMHVERDGVVLRTAQDLSTWWHSVTIQTSSYLRNGGADLVISLCDGEVVRVPLSQTSTFPALSIRGATIDGDQVGVDWYSDNPTDDLLVALGPESGKSYCHVAGANPVPVSVEAQGATGVLHVLPLIELPAVTTPRGTAHIWIEGDSTPEVIGYPVDDGTGWYVVDALHPLIALSIGGISRSVLVDTFAFQWAGGGWRMRVEGETFSYVAGADTDHLEISYLDELYEADFPHVSPELDLQVAVPLDPLVPFVELHLGPLTVTAPSGATSMAGLTASFQQGPIPVPAGAVPP